MGVIFIVFFLLFGFIVFSVVTLKSLKNSEVDFGKSKPIAVLELNGVILESKKFVKLLHKAERDEKTKAIVIHINSPGGVVGPTQEIYEEIRRIDQDVKPVFSSFGSVAASGGYYIGAATRKIYSTPGVITGSIGVVMQFMNLEKLYEFAKLKPDLVKAGKYKDIGSPARQMTGEERAILNKMIQNVHQQFIKDILKTRADRIKGNIETHAQGQIYSGEEALALGLVDELKGLYAATRAVHKELGIEEEYGLNFIKEPKKLNIQDIMEGVEGSLKSIQDFMYLRNTPQLMYLMGQ